MYNKIFIFIVGLFLLNACGTSSDNNQSLEDTVVISVDLNEDEQGNLEGENNISSGISISSNREDINENIKKILTPEETALLGEWFYVDSGRAIEITSESVSSFVSKGSNLLEEVKDDGSKYYLIRQGIANVKVQGEVHQLVNVAKSPSRNVNGYANIASMKLILSNLKNKDLKKEHSIEKEDISISEDSSTIHASFEVEDVVRGEYEINATNSETNETVSTIKTLKGEVSYIGVLNIPDDEGYNFKTELLMADPYVYGDLKIYHGKVRIHNIGEQEATALSFKITTQSKYIENFTENSSIGTVEKGGFIEFDISFKCNYMDIPEDELLLNINIKDVYFNEWNDYIKLPIYQSSIRINVKSDASKLKGYLIVTGHELIPIDTVYAAIDVPYLPAKQYILLLSNPLIGNETRYSVGVNTAVSDYEELKDATAYEPNNSEENAKELVLGDSIIAFMHKGDLDYYIINMFNNNTILKAPPQIPFK